MLREDKKTLNRPFGAYNLALRFRKKKTVFPRSISMATKAGHTRITDPRVTETAQVFSLACAL